MARLYTDFPFSGTFGNLTVYRLGDRCYARTKSSLDRKRFLKDPAFAKSREKATQFGVAAQLVKTFYRQLPKATRRHGLFGQLTGMATRLLQQGQKEADVVEQLQQTFLPTATLKTSSHTQAPKRGALSLSRWTVSPKGKLHCYPVQVMLPLSHIIRQVRSKHTALLPVVPPPLMPPNDFS